MESAIQAPTTEAPETPKGKPFALIGVIALGLAIGAGAGLYVVGPKFSKPPAAAASSEKHGGTTAGSEKAGTGESEPKTMHVVDNLVLNPAGSGGTRFLMVNATFEVKDAAALELMKTHDAEVRDILLAELGHKTVEELTDTAARDALKKEMLLSLSPLFPAGSLKRVFFPQFVIQ
ncbi:N/A [soil metagenome]